MGELKRILSGDVIDAVALDDNFVELENRIKDTSSVDKHVQATMIPLIQSTNDKTIQAKKYNRSGTLYNYDVATKYNEIYVGNFEKLATLPYIVKVSDKTLLPTWYRIWNNGFIEAKGIGTAVKTKKSLVVTMPFEMADTDYHVMVTGFCTYDSDDLFWVKAKTQTTFTIFRTSTGAAGENELAATPYWYVSGYIKEAIKEEDLIVLKTEPEDLPKPPEAITDDRSSLGE